MSDLAQLIADAPAVDVVPLLADLMIGAARNTSA
jgi:hypothetical protein